MQAVVPTVAFSYTKQSAAFRRGMSRAAVAFAVGVVIVALVMASDSTA